jgi:hypothetical protein
MSTRCAVCKLEEGRRQAVEDALRADIPLAELSASTGISRSGLSRHTTRHMGMSRITPLPKVPAIKPTEPAIESKTLVPATTPSGEHQANTAVPCASKASLLSRIEYLWNESLEGLDAAKEPIVIARPDGTEMEMPGDLRARAAFIREARQVLELQGAATGGMGNGSVSNTLIVLMPTAPAIEPPIDAEWEPVEEEQEHTDSGFR